MNCTRYFRLSVIPVALLCAMFAGKLHAQSNPALQYAPVVYTIAGGATTATICPGATDTIGDGCIGTQAIMADPIGDAEDAAGNMYIADQNHNVIRRIDAVTGIVTVAAGQINSTATTTVCSAKTDAIGDGCSATQAIFSAPHSVRFDHEGNLVVVDTSNQVVRRIDKTTGIVTLLMGEVGKASATPPNNALSPTPSPSATELDSPYFVVFDPQGNMFVSCVGGNFVAVAMAINGEVDPANSSVYNVAGIGKTGTTGNGGLATAAALSGPRGIALDATGNLYIGDQAGAYVQRVTSGRVNGQLTLAGIKAATISVYAGTGTQGTTGDGGAAMSAEIDSPQDLIVDNFGDLVIEQSTSNYLRLVNPINNTISSFAGTGPNTFTGDAGPAARATFNVPLGVIMAPGNQWTLSDELNNRIRAIHLTPYFPFTASGKTTAAQNVAVQATAAVTLSTAVLSTTEFKIGAPSGCTFGTALAAAAYCMFPLTFTPAGPGLRISQLKITDNKGNAYTDNVVGIGLAPAAAFVGAPITTLAGNGTAGSSGNSGAATAALINAPRGSAFDSLGNFYFSDSGNHVVRMISKSTGNISIVAGTGTSGYSGDGAAATSAQLNDPTGLVIDPAGNIYIADTGNSSIRKVSASTGFISTIAGTGTAGYTGDFGLAIAATLNHPTGLALDTSTVLYVADTSNNVVRGLSISGGLIVTIAGTGAAGYSNGGSVPQLAELNAPTAVAVDLSGNIYVADTGNAIVRRILPVNPGLMNFQANISNYAGIPGGTENTGDGAAATAANLLSPSGLGVDAAGDLYIAAGGQVRMVNALGTIFTLAGDGSAGSYSGEGDSATDAVIPSPAQDLSVDSVGNVYLSDTAGNRILKVAGTSAATVDFGSQISNTASSPQEVMLYNSGNQPLTLTNITVPTAFSLSSTGNACASTTVVAPGAFCTLTITFTPASVANYASQITITDNSLGNTSSTQTIPLTGMGVAHLNPTTTVLTYSPATPSYGQTITVTATVKGTPTPTGKVNFIVNSGVETPEGLNAAGQATLELAPGVGADTITGDYVGDSVNADSTGSTSFTVAPGLLTVTASNQSRYPTVANPTLTYSIKGFVNGDTATTATTGAPALSTTATTASTPGTYPITVAQGTLAAANYTLNFVNGTLTVMNSTFTLTISPTSLTIPTGQVGSTIVTITPSPGYSGTVNLSCGTLPVDAICTFKATSLNVSPEDPQTTQLSISTNNKPEIGAGGISLWSLASFVVVLLVLRATRVFRRRPILRNGLLAVLLLTLINLTGCASGTLKAPPYSGNVTVTAIDTPANIKQSVPLALTIQ